MPLDLAAGGAGKFREIDEPELPRPLVGREIAPAQFEQICLGDRLVATGHKGDGDLAPLLIRGPYDGGLAKIVLVVGGDSLLTGLTPDLALRSLTESRDQQYEMPFGIPVANTFAMTAHRHMKDFGTTPEQLAEVAVVQRRHAARTPGAQQTKPITVDDVLNSGLVTTPYHKLDCSLISDGGAAFVLTSAEHAKELGIEKPI